MKNIKELALAKMAGYRHQEVSVPEWGGVKVILREPSGEAWLRWQAVAEKDKDNTALSITERAQINLDADIVLFMDTVLDADFEPVCGAEDESVIRAVYGPVHSRLVRQALNLIATAAEVKEKSQPPA